MNQSGQETKVSGLLSCIVQRRKNNTNCRNKNLRKVPEEDLGRMVGKEGFEIARLKQKIKIIRTTFNQKDIKNNKD